MYVKRHLRTCVVLSILAGSIRSVLGELQNVKVSREIDLTSQTYIQTTNVVVRNVGSKPEPVYLILLSKEQAGNFSYVEVEYESDDGMEGIPTRVGSQELEITLAEPLAPGAEVSLEIFIAFTRMITPFPAQVAQGDMQKFLFEDSHYYLSAYPTKEQETIVKLSTSHVEAYTELSPSAKRGERLQLGPYRHIAARSWSPLRLHFESVAVFLGATKLVREIQVSHWGWVEVEERYELEHRGPRLAGEWSRYQFQRHPLTAGAGAIGIVPALLPPRASHLYYRDRIGNISTSQVRRAEEYTEVDLLPRYPLFGGWRAAFRFGYRLELADAVKRTSQGRWLVKLPLASPIEEVVVDHLELRVVLPDGGHHPKLRGVLPEGGHHPKWAAPFRMVEGERETKFGYLDTTGRTVVVLHLHNVMTEHNQPFQVSYTYNPIWRWRKPLLVAVAAAVVLAAAVACQVAGGGGGGRRARERLEAVYERRCRCLHRLRTCADAAGNAVDPFPQVRRQVEAALAREAKRGAGCIAALEAAGDEARLPLVRQLEARHRDLELQTLALCSTKAELGKSSVPAKQMAQRIQTQQKAVAFLDAEVRLLFQKIEFS